MDVGVFFCLFGFFWLIPCVCTHWAQQCGRQAEYIIGERDVAGLVATLTFVIHQQKYIVKGKIKWQSINIGAAADANSWVTDKLV